MNNNRADLLGIISAILCIIHCLLLPLFILFGLISESTIDRWEFLEWGFILLSGLAVYLANRHEHDRHEHDRHEHDRHEYDRHEYVHDEVANNGNDQPEDRPPLAKRMWIAWLFFSVAILLHDVWVPAIYFSVLSSVGLVWLHMQHFRKKHWIALIK